MEDKTTGVLYNSFTRRLIEELEKSAKAGETSVSAWQLHDRLMGRKSEGDLDYTPRFYGLSRAETPSIELRSHKGSLDHSSNQTGYTNSSGQAMIEDASSYCSPAASTTNDWYTYDRRILVSINLIDWTKLPPVMQWERWLTEKAPKNIESMKLFFESGTTNQSTMSGTTAITRSDVPAFLDDVYVPGLRERRRKTNLQGIFPVSSEAVYNSDSTLLLLSLPLPLWKYLQHDPAYRFVGVIRSPNLLRRPTLSRSPSIPEKVEESLSKANRYWWWYKWYVGFLVSAGLVGSLLNIRHRGKWAVVLWMIFSTVLGALPPLSLMTFEDSFADLSLLDARGFAGGTPPRFQEPANFSFWNR